LFSDEVTASGDTFSRQSWGQPSVSVGRAQDRRPKSSLIHGK
jgi:hypothetical protein